MNTRVIYKKAVSSDFEAVAAVLTQCNLPVSDLHPEMLSGFIVAKATDKIIGTIGVQAAGKEGLVRSVAVLPAYRNKGVADRLLKNILKLSKELNISTLHLLTGTAEIYFAQKGFKKAERSGAPAVIQETAEFALLCPSSAVYMTKNV